MTYRLQQQMQLLPILALVSSVARAQKSQEDISFGDWILQHIIIILGLTVLFLVFLWCCCSIHAGRAEKRAQELRRQNRQEQEEEELTIQTSLYNRQEEQQRKILQILQDRLTEKTNARKAGDKEIIVPAYIADHVAVDQMQREEIEDEFAKITPDQIEQLDDDSKREIKIAQDNIAQLEEKLELY